MLSNPVMTIEEIMGIIPHRYPFLLIDRVIELDEHDVGGNRVGRKVKALKNVTINEPFFQGHFPHRPVMPGVLLVEAMAQAGAIACYRPTDPLMDVSVASLKATRFRAPVVPGDTLELRAEVIKDRGHMILLDCEARVNGRVVAETELLASVVPIEKPK